MMRLTQPLLLGSLSLIKRPQYDCLKLAGWKQVFLSNPLLAKMISLALKKGN